MNLPEKVNSEITAAMKAKNEPRLRTYRNIKAQFLLLQSSGSDVAEDGYLKAIQNITSQEILDTAYNYFKENTFKYCLAGD